MRGRPSCFSILPLVGVYGGSVGFLGTRIRRGALFRFEIRSLDDELSVVIRDCLESCVCRGLVRWSVGCVKLLSYDMRVVSPRSLLSGVESYVGCRSFSVVFFTPTCFRVKPFGVKVRRTRYLILPDPISLLSGLYRVWNAYFSPKIGEDYIKWLHYYSVVVAGVDNLRSLRVYEYEGDRRKKYDVGFVGSVRYSFVEDTYDKMMAFYTYLLLKFGEYSNVGRNRSSGFGVIKLIVPLSEFNKERGEDNRY